MKSEGSVVEQLIRPTGLVDPPIRVKITGNQIDDLMEEIEERVQRNEKILITTLPKRMAEELSKYFDRVGVRNRYIHSDVDTLARVEILNELRTGMFDVLIGVNLLREGLDLPEVSLVAIMDADKEGFLRSERSLTQTSGRAARHANGNVILYAERRTDSMATAIMESNRRREKQIIFNMQNGLIPHAAQKTSRAIMSGERLDNSTLPYPTAQGILMAADIRGEYSTREELQEAMAKAKLQMENAARELDFIEAARHRDLMYALQERLGDRPHKSSAPTTAKRRQ
jgi:excinuclease ABC subunit B